MFRVKICGITNVEDAIAAVEAGADAIGLNFYDKSPRCVDREVARSISQRMENYAPVVGVFVNHSVDVIHSIAAETPLDLIQAHGDETPEVLKSIEGYDLIWVRRYAANALDPIANLIEDANDFKSIVGWRPFMLLDAPGQGSYGGTGHRVSWEKLRTYRKRAGADIDLILAGGLTPDNVAEAIRIVRPTAVDVASGVESAPGKKDPAKVRDFVANALGAFAAHSGTQPPSQ